MRHGDEVSGYLAGSLADVKLDPNCRSKTSIIKIIYLPEKYPDIIDYKYKGIGCIRLSFEGFEVCDSDNNDIHS